MQTNITIILSKFLPEKWVFPITSLVYAAMLLPIIILWVDNSDTAGIYLDIR